MSKRVVVLFICLSALAASWSKLINQTPTTGNMPVLQAAWQWALQTAGRMPALLVKSNFA